MTHTAIALYLGESYATTCAFDLLNPKSSVKDSQPAFEKSVYLPQTSLKSLMAQAAAALPDTPVKSVFVVTRYMDRLKSFRLGGSVIQVVPEGFENSYSLTNTQQQSLAAPALILPIQPSATEESLAADLARLKKVNSEINKVVFQLPETLFTQKQIHTIKSFFEKENFKLFSIPNPFDFESVRKTLLNAGSEGTKEEILSDIKDAFGPETKIHFWIGDQFSETFENIDLYFSSQCFIKNYLKRSKLEQAYYFDLENWNSIALEDENQWQSPWGTINYPHPKCEEFTMSPYCELTVNSIGQLIISKAPPQFEPGPIVAGRSVKTLILDALSEELKDNKLIASLFPQLATESIQQKVNNQFQILQKAQTLDDIRLSKLDIKNWLRFSVTTWILQSFQSRPTQIIGDLGSFFSKDLKKTPKLSASNFSWTHEIMLQAKGSQP
ncbi:MAG: hypothetical protein A3D17_13850 [Bdellovibrionales bacterium RIFCSPHIGHO2_02_FULL_40_15]|nr:MAG: hypothetical protein A3D17_13850 [Bdellovibrionales bacterium RIFCSPHIGHO2_02_FULL_40_15]